MRARATVGGGVVRPYYEESGIVIYHGDCREVLPLEADILLTDPPYSSGGYQEAGRSAGSIGTRSTATISADNLSTRGYRRLMREVLRGCRVDEVYLFTDWRMWIEAYDALEDGGWRVRNMLVWDKRTMGMGMPWRNQHELIAFAKRTAGEIRTGNRGNVLAFQRSGNEYHPTEKPLDLVQAILDNAQPGTVLDPFMGSGTTLVAAKNLARPAVGIELDERFCEVAAQRLSQGVLDFGGAA